jgi:hypothetical protein
MWLSDADGGTLWDAARLVVVGLAAAAAAGLRVWVAARMPAGRVVVEEVSALGFGVTLLSAMDGNLDLFWEDGAGVLSREEGFGSEADVSDLGGDGGSVSIGAPFLGGGRAITSGGVVMSGELAVERGEFPKTGDSGMEISVEMVERWRFSAFLTLSCRISASTLRSDSSSRSRWASIRNVSRSFSPILTSSSIMTLRSIAWLYLDSISSRVEVVFRACLSKSSLTTSMSRNRS